MTTPNVPTIAAANDTARGCITLTITGTDTPPLATDANRTFDVQRSADGGGTWSDVRLGRAATTLAQVQTRYDTETPQGAARVYRARAVYDDGVAVTYSAWTAATASVTRDVDGWWLQCPERPTLGARVFVDPKFSGERQQTKGVFTPLGATREIVLTGETYGDHITIKVRTIGAAQFDAVVALWQAGRTLCLVDDMGNLWYLAPVGSMSWEVVATAGRAANPMRWVQFPAVEVAAP